MRSERRIDLEAQKNEFVRRNRLEHLQLSGAEGLITSTVTENGAKLAEKLLWIPVEVGLGKCPANQCLSLPPRCPAECHNYRR